MTGYKLGENSSVTAGLVLPFIAFVSIVALERAMQPPATAPSYSRADRLLNFGGLVTQGLVVPAAGYFIATRVLAAHWPEAAGTLRIGWLGAFVLNFVVVDFLYYWQHRLFHAVPVLWALHQCHHASPKVSVWATSRNSFAINFLFVYMLVNPLLGFLCDRPDVFFTAAAVTATLDLWRHSRLPANLSPRWLGRLLVVPSHHHAHHNPDGQTVNFGANLILWDRLFGTARDSRTYPDTYGTPGAPGPWRQFFYPW
jgi:sterol desaturase/sphingolipid hydroxylase (fatty acid hydroxylase superfamily)